MAEAVTEIEMAVEVVTGTVTVGVVADVREHAGSLAGVAGSVYVKK